MRTPRAEDFGIVNRVIFDELCQGVIRDESRAEYLRIIHALKDSGCDAVALCCTELPLLIAPDVSPLPTLDSTRRLATAAVATACGDAAPAGGCGGPIPPDPDSGRARPAFP